jgi:opacity protein-like surface antigen
MKKLMIVALAASIATPAFAQAVTETNSVAFTGNRAVECDISGLDTSIEFGALGRRGAAGAETDNGVDLFCNQPFRAQLRSLNGFLRLNTFVNPSNGTTEGTENFESQANPGFAAGLNYTATVTLGSSSFTGDSSQIPGGNTLVTLGNSPALDVNNASIRYDTVAGELPLLGGDYSDTLTLVLTTLGV